MVIDKGRSCTKKYHTHDPSGYILLILLTLKIVENIIGIGFPINLMLNAEILNFNIYTAFPENNKFIRCFMKLLNLNAIKPLMAIQEELFLGH